jgi:hypothetical protein
MLSPKDWEVMGEWQQKGIPLRVVLHGIDKAFMDKGSLKQEVNFLAYCKPQVNKCWREYRKQMLGRANSSVNKQAAPNQFILQHLSALQQKLQVKLKQAGDLLPVWQQAQRSVAGLISLARGADLSSLDQIGPQLNAIRRRLLADLRANMPKSELDRMEAAAMAELKDYRRWMQPEAYQATYEELVDEWVLKYYGLPQLRLYDLY